MRLSKSDRSDRVGQFGGTAVALCNMALTLRAAGDASSPLVRKVMATAALSKPAAMRGDLWILWIVLLRGGQVAAENATTTLSTSETTFTTTSTTGTTTSTTSTSNSTTSSTMTTITDTSTSLTSTSFTATSSTTISFTSTITRTTSTTTSSITTVTSTVTRTSTLTSSYTTLTSTTSQTQTFLRPTDAALRAGLVPMCTPEILWALQTDLFSEVARYASIGENLDCKGVNGELLIFMALDRCPEAVLIEVVNSLARSPSLFAQNSRLLKRLIGDPLWQWQQDPHEKHPSPSVSNKFSFPFPAMWELRPFSAGSMGQSSEDQEEQKGEERKERPPTAGPGARLTEINKILKAGRAWDKNKDRRTRARSKKQEEVVAQEEMDWQMKKRKREAISGRFWARIDRTKSKDSFGVDSDEDSDAFISTRPSQSNTKTEGYDNLEDLFKDELDDAPGADIMERKPMNLDCPSESDEDELDFEAISIDKLKLRRVGTSFTLSHFFNCTTRNSVTGRIVMKEDRYIPGFVLVDLFGRRRLIGNPEQIMEDHYIFRPHVLSHRTWIYHKYAKDPRRLAQVNGKDSMNGMIKKILSIECIDVDVNTGRHSPLFAWMISSGEDLAMQR
eukprot:symbB.v1.2.021326.t1/scaffold1838.1/size108694/6